MKCTSRIRWTIYLLPACLILMGMGRLEEPQYYMDSYNKPSDGQALTYRDPRYGRDIASASEPSANSTVAYNSQQGDLHRFQSTRQGVKSNYSQVDNISPQQAHKYGVQEFSIIATKRGYYPKSIIVRRNIPVNIYLTTTESRDLCFIMKGEDFSIHKGVGSKDIVKVSFEPRRTGPYRFHCPINNLSGTMIVRD